MPGLRSSLPRTGDASLPRIASEARTVMYTNVTVPSSTQRSARVQQYTTKSCCAAVWNTRVRYIAHEHCPAPTAWSNTALQHDAAYSNTSLYGLYSLQHSTILLRAKEMDASEVSLFLLCGLLLSLTVVWAQYICTRAQSTL